jgi:hypothetical protein
MRKSGVMRGRLPQWVALTAAVMLTGCVSEPTLAPTPAIYTGAGARQQFVT